MDTSLIYHSGRLIVTLPGASFIIKGYIRASDEQLETFIIHLLEHTTATLDLGPNYTIISEPHFIKINQDCTIVLNTSPSLRMDLVRAIINIKYSDAPEDRPQ